MHHSLLLRKDKLVEEGITEDYARCEEEDAIAARIISKNKVIERVRNMHLFHSCFNHYVDAIVRIRNIYQASFLFLSIV